MSFSFSIIDFLLFLSLALNIFLTIKHYIITFVRRRSTPHILAVYGNTDFNKEQMLKNLFDSGIKHTFIDSGINKEYLIKALEQKSVNIFELSTHGTKEGFYLFDELFSFSWLKGILKYSNIRLVLLLSCGSHAYESIIDTGCVVVSLAGEVEDSVVLGYTKELYRLLEKRVGYREASIKAKAILSDIDYHKVQVRWNNND